MLRIWPYSAITGLLLFTPSLLWAEGHSIKTRAAHVLWKIHADLDAAAAIPSSSEPATGDVAGTYDTTTHMLRFNARFYSLSGPALYARFHGPAAIDRMAAAMVAAPRPEARLVSGTAWLDQEQEQDLLEGRWYFNVTTEKHPQGEIRGMVRASPDQQRK